MAVMMGNLYAALREAGVPDDKAQRAAEEMAAVADVVDVKSDVATLKSDVTRLKADTAVMKWMLGFVVATNVAIFSKLFLGSH
jgi:hypothetical protein